MIKPYRSKWTKWSFLGELGRSRPVQLSVFFPTIGYLLLFSDATHNWLCGAGDVVCSLGDPLPWKLVSAYFGLVLLGAGTLVFGLKCPRIHVRYADEIEFIEREISLNLGGGKRWGIDLLRHKMILSHEAMPENLAEIYERSIDGLRDSDKGASADIGYLFYQVLDWSRPRWRVATAILFGCGFVLLAVPSLATTVQIIARLDAIWR